MTDLVDPEHVEEIVGMERHDWDHYGRAVTDEQKFYILHPRECLKRGTDLRLCHYSRALDAGINEVTWEGYKDRTVRLATVRLAAAPHAQEDRFVLIPHPTDWSGQPLKKRRHRSG